MTYLITGASGFLGKELTHVLQQQGQVSTLGRSSDNQIVCDLSRHEPQINDTFEVIVHNAGKAHVVPRTAEEKQAFFNVNYQGTLNLLESLKHLNPLPKAFIFISTIAVYGLEAGEFIDENTPLNANDPYGKSKIMAEQAVLDWGQEHQITIGILRLPLIAGPQPLGNLQKMINAQKAGYYPQIGDGNARKSMVVAQDIANIIPKVAEIGGIYNLTDGYHPSFQELGSLFANKLEVSPPMHLPTWFAKLLAFSGDFGGKVLGKNLPFNSRQFSKMTSSLTFSDQKARKKLGWKPQSVLSYLSELPKSALVHG